MIPHSSIFVMAGLGPAIHEPHHGKSGADRDRPGQDEVKN
jgi:hypothetical protein